MLFRSSADHSSVRVALSRSARHETRSTAPLADANFTGVQDPLRQAHGQQRRVGDPVGPSLVHLQPVRQVRWREGVPQGACRAPADCSTSSTQLSQVLEIYRDPPTPSHKGACMAAMCATRDPALLKRTFDFVLTDEVKNQVRSLPLTILSRRVADVAFCVPRTFPPSSAVWPPTRSRSVTCGSSSRPITTRSPAGSRVIPALSPASIILLTADRKSVV